MAEQGEPPEDYLILDEKKKSTLFSFAQIKQGQPNSKQCNQSNNQIPSSQVQRERKICEMKQQQENAIKEQRGLQIKKFKNVQAFEKNNEQMKFVQFYLKQIFELFEQFKDDDKTKLKADDQRFKFFCSEQNPQSLVMLWPLEQMPGNLIKDSGETLFIFFSTSQDLKQNQIYQRAKKQLESITKKSIKVINTFEKLIQAEQQKQTSKSQQNIVLFTQNDISEEYLSQTKAEIYIYKSSISQCNQIKTSKVQYVNEQQELIQKLKKYKPQKQLPNFLYIDPQDILTSNRLVKVFYTMLNQKIDEKTRLGILEQFGRLLLMIGQKSSFYYNYKQSINEFVNNLKNNERVIYWYTAETSFYKVLNNLLRSTRHPAEIYYLQPFFKSLYNKIKDMFRQKVEKQGKRNFTCYRGTWMTQAEIEKLKNSNGEVIMNLGFMSTTLVQGFGTGMGNCYLEIQVNQEEIDEKLCQGYANIEDESFHPFQREVLFNPLNSFLILGFRQDPKTKRVTFKLSYGVLSQLQSTPDKYLYKTQYGRQHLKNINLQKKDVIQKAKILKDIANSQRQYANKAQCQGETLIEDNVNLQGCEIYWSKYQQILKKTHEENINIKYACQLQKQIKINWAKRFLFCKKAIIYNKQEYSKYISVLLKQIQMARKIIVEQRFKVYTVDKQGNIQEFWYQLKGDTNSGIDLNDKYLSELLTNLGAFYQMKGDQDSSFKAYKEAEQIYNQKIGNNNQEYANLVANLALSYQVKGDYEKAIQNYQKAEEILKLKVGIYHKDYATVLVKLGNVYQIKRDYEKAIQNYHKAKNIFKLKVGIYHNNYATVLVNLGNIYQLKGQYDTAISAYETAKEIYRRGIGTNNNSYAMLLLNFGNIYKIKGQYDSAISAYETVKEIYRRTIGTNNSNYATLLLNLGNIYQIKGQYDSAISTFETAKEIKRAIGADKSLQYATILVSIGAIKTKTGEYDSAVKFYEEAKMIYQEKLGLNHSDYANVLVGLGIIYHKKREYEAEKNILLQAQKIYNLKGKQNPRYYANFLVTKGNALKASKEYEKAINVFEQAKQFCKEKLGVNHNDYADLLVNLGNIYTQKSNYERAINLYEEAKQIYKAKFGTNHLYYARVQANLGALYIQIEEYGKALPLFQSSSMFFCQSCDPLSIEYISIITNFSKLLFKLSEFNKCQSKLLDCRSKLIKLAQVNPFKSVQQLFVITVQMLANVYLKKNMPEELIKYQEQFLILKMPQCPQKVISALLKHIKNRNINQLMKKNPQLKSDILNFCKQFLILYQQIGMDYLSAMKALPEEFKINCQSINNLIVEACLNVIYDLKTSQSFVEAKQTIKFLQLFGYHLTGELQKISFLQKKYKTKVECLVIGGYEVLCSWETQEKKQVERSLRRIIGKNNNLYVLIKWLQINEIRMLGRYEEAEIILKQILSAIEKGQISDEALELLWDQI